MDWQSGTQWAMLTRNEKKHCKQCHLHTVQIQISWNQYQFNDVDEKQSIVLLLLGANGEGRGIIIFYIHGDMIICIIIHKTSSKQWRMGNINGTHARTHMQQCVVELMEYKKSIPVQYFSSSWVRQQRRDRDRVSLLVISTNMISQLN